MEKNQKLFAFKLSVTEDAKKDQNSKSTANKWKAQEGAAIAGCTPYKRPGNLRYSDFGAYC